jgi:MFS superfamily sulfate permease-like transporter
VGLHLSRFGVVTVGRLPKGFPAGSCCIAGDGVIPLAAACLLLSYIESISAARAFAAKYDYPLDVRQELLGLALPSCCGSGRVSRGWWIVASAMNEKPASATRPAVRIRDPALLLFLTGLLRDLPKQCLPPSC